MCTFHENLCKSQINVNISQISFIVNEINLNLVLSSWETRCVAVIKFSQRVILVLCFQQKKRTKGFDQMMNRVPTCPYMIWTVRIMEILSVSGMNEA
jgi:hypothetical protein